MFIVYSYSYNASYGSYDKKHLIEEKVLPFVRIMRSIRSYKWQTGNPYKTWKGELIIKQTGERTIVVGVRRRRRVDLGLEGSFEPKLGGRSNFGRG